MTKVERLLDNVNALAQTLDKLTKRKRRFKLQREHIETAVEVGSGILTLLGGKYVLAAKAASVISKLQARIQRPRLAAAPSQRTSKPKKQRAATSQPTPIRSPEAE